MADGKRLTEEQIARMGRYEYCAPCRGRGWVPHVFGSLGCEPCKGTGMQCIVDLLAEREALLAEVAAARAAALEEAARVSCCDVCADEFRARAATPPPTKE